MGGNKVTPRARALGNALRDARQAAGLDQRALADRVDIHHSALSRYETGQRTPSTETVSALLAVLGVNGVDREEIIDLARDNGGPWLAVSLPEQRQQLAALLDFERSASRIVEVSPVMIPGLLQTARFARAIMVAAGVPADEIEMRVHVRLGRASALTRDADPVHLLAVIGEAAIRQMVGGRLVMIEQLRHLLTASRWPTVDLRVIPFSASWNPAMDGPFLLIESPEQPPVVHLENRRSGLFLHGGPDLETYRQAVDAVLQVALSPSDSVELIADRLNRMEKIKQ